MQLMPCALDFAFARAGSSRAARIAMMAITTSSSISVNPDFVRARAQLTRTVRHSGIGPRLWRSPAAAASIFRRAPNLFFLLGSDALRLGFATAAVRLTDLSLLTSSPAMTGIFQTRSQPGPKAGCQPAFGPHRNFRY